MPHPLGSVCYPAVASASGPPREPPAARGLGARPCTRPASHLGESEPRSTRNCPTPRCTSGMRARSRFPPFERTHQVCLELSQIIDRNCRLRIASTPVGSGSGGGKRSSSSRERTSATGPNLTRTPTKVHDGASNRGELYSIGQSPMHCWPRRRSAEPHSSAGANPSGSGPKGMRIRQAPPVRAPSMPNTAESSTRSSRVSASRQTNCARGSSCWGSRAIGPRSRCPACCFVRQRSRKTSGSCRPWLKRRSYPGSTPTKSWTRLCPRTFTGRAASTRPRTPVGRH